MKLHFGGGKYRRARAALADDNRKSLGANDRRHLEPPLKSSDMRELDLQKIRGLLFQHGQRLFRRAHAFLRSDGNTDRATQFGEASEIASCERLLSIGEAPRAIGYLGKEQLGNLDELVKALTQIALGEVVIDRHVISKLTSRRRTTDLLERLGLTLQHRLLGGRRGLVRYLFDDLPGRF